MDRTDLDIPESTVWPASDEAPQAPVATPERLAEEEANAGAGGAGTPAAAAADSSPADSSGEQSPSLDPDVDDGADRAPKL